MVSINKNLCNNCGICVGICPRKILRPGKESVEVIDQALCMACGHCKAVCPTDAPGFAAGNEDFEPLSMKEKILSPSDLLHFIRRRRSIRQFLQRSVDKEELTALVQAGRYSPTGGNRQACAFSVIRGRKILDEVCALAIRQLLGEARVIREVFERHERFQEPIPEGYASRKVLPSVWERIGKAWEGGQDQLLYDAPALILIHVNEESATTGMLDAGLASMNMLHMAETLGLGSCYIAFLVWAVQGCEALRSFLQIPAGNRLHVAFAVGYPKVKYLRLVARKPANVTWLGESQEE